MPHNAAVFLWNGLSIRRFSIRIWRFPEKKFFPGSCVDISFKPNTGKVKGYETAQLYIRDVYASEVRPAMELTGLRVELGAR